MNNYYTYAYLREDKTPYYIGKGKGKRIYSTTRTLKLPKDKSRIILLKQNLTEEKAFRHEIYMIALFGRKDLGTGILRNLTDGGEGASGRILTEETKKKIGEANKGKTLSEENKRKISGRNHYLYGKTHSEETRKKVSEALQGEKNHFYGQTHSEETRRKISEVKKNPSKETIRKISEANKGRTASEETRKKLSKAHKGKTLSEEHRRKMSEKAKERWRQYRISKGLDPDTPMKKKSKH